jgi:hypothetical protein
MSEDNSQLPKSPTPKKAAPFIAELGVGSWQIADWELTRPYFSAARASEDVRDGGVAFVTCVLVHGIGTSRASGNATVHGQVHVCGSWTVTSSRRVLASVSVNRSTRRRASLTRRVPVAVPAVRTYLPVEIRRLDHQRVAVPMPTRVAHVGANRSRQMRPAIEGNDPRLMDHLVKNDDRAWPTRFLVA